MKLWLLAGQRHSTQSNQSPHTGSAAVKTVEHRVLDQILHNIESFENYNYILIKKYYLRWIFLHSLKTTEKSNWTQRAAICETRWLFFISPIIKTSEWRSESELWDILLIALNMFILHTSLTFNRDLKKKIIVHDNFNTLRKLTLSSPVVRQHTF